MTIELEDVAASRQILIVEDEEHARTALAELLAKRGYQVFLADSGSNATLQARQENFGVVLMDIVLGDEREMDGIQTARQIQDDLPLTSFIFVSAHIGDPHYVDRIYSSGVRVGGLVEKPIRIEDLAALIAKEVEKLRLLSWLAEISERGGDAFWHLNGLQDSLSPTLYSSLLDELRAGEFGESEEILPLAHSEDEAPLMQIIAQIDQVYSEIQRLVARPPAGSGSLKAALRPLRARLEALEEQEADALERRFRNRLQFDPAQGRQLIERAEALLRKR